MDKRGVTQVDWAISLAIFLLFLVWIFFFTKPLFDSTSNLDSLADIVEKHFKETVTIEIEKIPLIVHSNWTYENEPFLIDYSYDPDITNYFLAVNKSIQIKDNKMVFQQDISNTTTIINLIHSTDLSFPQYKLANDLTSNERWASVTNFIAYFDNSTLDTISYRGPTKIFKHQIFIDDVLQTNHSGSYTNTSQYAKYVYSNQALNFTMYIFTENPGISGEIKLNQVIPGLNKTMKIYLELVNYTDYYMDRVEKGEVDYFFETCEEADDRNFIDLYDDVLGGVAVTVDTASKTKICGEPKRANLTFTFQLHNSTRYRLMFHDGNYENGTKYKDFNEPVIGAIQSYKGIDVEKMNNLTLEDYVSLREGWNFPLSNNFQIEVWNSTSKIFAYEPVEQTTQTNIYTKQFYSYILDSDINLRKVKVFVRVW